MSLVFFHDATGSLDPVISLSQRIQGVRVVGVPAQDSDTFAELTAYVELCLTRLALSGIEAPWMLAGFSFGGVLAFEAARQLSLSRQEVALLALLDTDPPQPLRWRNELEDTASRVLPDPEHGAPLSKRIAEAIEIRRMPFADLQTVLPASVLQSIPPHYQLFPGRCRKAVRRILESMEMLSTYEPPNAAAPQNTFYVRSREAAPSEYWQRLIAGPLTTIDIESDHLSLLGSEGRDVVATKLNSLISTKYASCSTPLTRSGGNG